MSNFDRIAAQHKYTPPPPPQSNAKFAVNEGELKATVETPQVYVPMVRTAGTDTAENEWIVADYPSGTNETFSLAWEVGDTYKEVRIDLAGKFTDIGEKVWLYHLNTNQIVVATNSITCVAKPGNALTFPHLPGEVESLDVGEWSLDSSLIDSSSNKVARLRQDVIDSAKAYDNATNYLHYAEVTNETATAAYIDATNALAEAIATYDIATNNLFYAEATNETATAAYNTATGALATAQSGFLVASNTLYYAEVTNETATAAYASATNRLADAWRDYINVSNEYEIALLSPPIDEALQGRYDAATNELALAEAGTNETYCAYVAATKALAEAIAAYDGATNYLHYAEVTNETATAAYNTATGALATAQSGFLVASNTLYYAEVTNETATAAYNTATNDLFNAVSTTNTTYIAYVGNTNALDNAESGYFLVLSGSVVGNDEMGKIQVLFDSDDYRNWAVPNKVRNIVLDCPANATNSWTGASLLTYDTSVGTEIISVNGMSQSDAELYSQRVKDLFYARRRNLAEAGSPEVIVFRADGTYVGQLVESRIEDTKLKPAQKYQEQYNIDENIARLSDLLKLNGGAEEPLEVAYDETGEGDFCETTLQVNKSERYFYVMGLPTNAYFDLEFYVLPNLVTNANFKAEFQSSDIKTTNKWIAVKSAKRNTWTLNEDDLSTNVYRVVVSAYTAPRYEVYGPDTDFTVYFRFVPMSPDPGKIGFTETSKTTMEGSAASVDITVERTEWHSGSVTGYLHLVEGEGGTTAKPYRFSWPTNDVGEYVPVPLEWKNLELGAKTHSLTLNNDEIWDGDEKIVVMLTGDGEYGYVDFGAQTYTLTLAEDDSKSVGRIGFSSNAPHATQQTKPGVVFAKENTDIMLGVERIGGASGEASVKITATDGTVRTESLSWTDKDPETVKYVRVTLPALKSGQQQTTFYVSLVRDGEVPLVATSSRMQVRVLPGNAPEFSQANVPVVGYETTTVYQIIPLTSEIPEGATVTLSRSSGSLPSGVTVKYDREFSAIVVSGVPSKYGVFSATYQVVVRNGGKTTYSMPVTIGFTLGSRGSANAFVATAHVFNDLPVVDTNANRLVGLLDVTLPINGRHTAKFRSATGKTVSFTAEGWLSLAPDAATAYFSSKGTLRLAFSVSDAGAVTATLFDVDTDESFDIVRPAGETWSAAYPAAGYQGNYAVRLVPAGGGGAALCTGAAPLSLRMIGVGAVRTGKMTFAGTLPNGRSISGTAALMEAADATSAALPILSASAADTLTGIMRVVNGFGLTSTNYAAKAVRSEEGCATVWDHVEKKKPAEYSYYVEFDAFGSYIPSGLNWEEQWKRDFGTATLVFSIPGVSETTAISASGKTLKIADTRANPLGVAIRTFNATTGVLSGSAKVEGKTFSWSGALVPDWGRPMMDGACWRSESGAKMGDSATLDVGE